MASIEAIDSWADGDYVHQAELTNLARAASGCGVLATTLTLTVTGADRVVTYPSFAMTVPNGSGGVVGVVIAAGTHTADAGEAAGPRHDIGVYDVSAAAFQLVKGVATAEEGDVEDAPLPVLTADQVLVYRLRIEQSATVVATTAVKGRGIEIREQHYRTSADFTKNNNDTLGNVTGLAFVVGASQVWDYDFTAQALIGATPDIKVAITLPAAATGTGYAEKVNAASHLGARLADITASQTLADAAAGIALRGFGTVVSSTTPGTAQVQAAQGTATVEDTIVYSGASIRARRVA